MNLNHELRLELEKQYYSGNIIRFHSNYSKPKYHKYRKNYRVKGKQKYSEEFKLEAVRQVINLGCSTFDVANRLGISVLMLYLWVKIYSPDAIARYETELKEVRRENFKLKAVLMRAQKESDITIKSRSVQSKIHSQDPKNKKDDFVFLDFIK